MSAIAPLLNEYKYGLMVRRLLQSLTGGVKLQKGLPLYVYLIQWLLWLLPVLLSVPLIGISFVWNGYYLGIIYGVIMGTVLIVTNTIIGILIHMNSLRHSDGTLIDEDDPDISTYNDAINFIFAPKHPLNIFVHSVVSGLTAFSVFIIFDIPVLLSFLPIPLVVIVVPSGWLTMCISHYSLLVHPPYEMSVYRSYHQDTLQLKFITRSFHIMLTGIIYLILR